MPDYSRFADDALVERGRRLLEQDALAVTSSRQEEDGFLRIRGRSTDSFNFVDHPALLLGPEGKIRDFRCDCSEGRKGNFCVHCAALALKAEELLPRRAVQTPAPVMHAAAEAPVMKAAAPAEGEILRYSFPFSNSTQALYGADEAFLSDKNFFAVFGRTMIARLLYRKYKRFQGICYGMAAANSIFSWPGDNIPPSAFRREANLPYDLPLESFHREWSIALLDYLEMLFITQLHPTVRMGSRSLDQCGSPDAFFRELCSRIGSHRAGSAPLCTVGIIEKHGKNGGGHELLPYRVEEDEKGPLRIALYDCNYPGQERFIELKRSPEGKILGWSYDMGSHEMWGTDREGYTYMIDYTEHDLFHHVFTERPLPWDVGTAMLETSGYMQLRNAADATVLEYTEEQGYRSLDPEVTVIYPRTLEKSEPAVFLPAGRYHADVRNGENTEITLSLSTAERCAEIRTDAEDFDFEVDDRGQICAVDIPVAERTYYITLSSMDPQDHEEVRLEGITGYEPLRFGQIRHSLYVEGISERTQQDLYLNGAEASLDLLTRGFPQEEKQEQKKPERELLYNFPAEDPSGEED